MSSTKITIADIAKKLDLSPTTVSFVLNGRDNGISENTRESVLNTAAEMGYKKTFYPGAVSGWTKVAYVTGRIELFNSNTSFFAHVYSHLQKRSLADKVELFLMELNPDDTFINCNKRLQEFRAIGIDVCLSNSEQVVLCLAAAGFKAILVQGGIVPGSVCVYCDDYAAGREAALHALKMGHRNAGMIFWETESPRFKGFYETFTSNGGICDQKNIWLISYEHDKAALEIEKNAHSVKKLPSLFYCFADNIVFPALRGFTKAGFSVPDDVSLIGTDNLYWGSIATPAFTTVDLNEEIFAEKVSAAIKHVKNNGQPYHLAVPVKLIPRETVRKITAPNAK